MIEEPKETKEESKDLMLHTILLQNNALREIPGVLHEIPSLKVIQLHGNPCASAYETFKNTQNTVQNTKSEEPIQSGQKLFADNFTKLLQGKKMEVHISYT